MDTLFEDLIMLIFMHSVNTFLIIYITTKLFARDIKFRKLILGATFYAILSFLIRETIAFAGIPINIFIPLNLILFTVFMIFALKLPWRYAVLGMLISFGTMVLWAPVGYLIAKTLGWDFPNENLIISLFSAYLEMLGLIILAGYLKISNNNIFRLLRINKTNAESE